MVAAEDERQATATDDLRDEPGELGAGLENLGQERARRVRDCERLGSGAERFPRSVTRQPNEVSRSSSPA